MANGFARERRESVTTDGSQALAILVALACWLGFDGLPCSLGRYCYSCSSYWLLAPSPWPRLWRCRMPFVVVQNEYYYSVRVLTLHLLFVQRRQAHL